MPRRELTLFHLYPDLMNLYGDGGNVLALRRRCEWRGIGMRVVPVHLGDAADMSACDILFIGGGQDKAQSMVAEDLRARGEAIRRRVDEGLVALAVCGGFQLLGTSFVTSGGVELPGIGVFDAETVGGEKRLVGDIVIDTAIGHDPWLRSDVQGLLVGFENHSGVTRLGAGASPLGRVVSGFGNTGEGMHEGAVRGHAVGTYLHGALLPKNPWLADRLIAQALMQRYGDDLPLTPLDDALEGRAHDRAIQRCHAA